MMDEIFRLFLWLDAIIYDFIRYFYQIFLFLAKLNLFSNEEYLRIVNRIYIVIGVIMLFVLATTLLKAIINTENFNKGEFGFGNFVKNTIVSLIIIILLPTIFDVAFKVQNAILSTDIIGKLILGNEQGDNQIKNGGNTIASTVYDAFLYVSPDESGQPAGDGSDLEGGSKFLIIWHSADITFKEAKEKVRDGETFMYFVNFGLLVSEGKITYNFIISHLAGVFILWCILLFCFDLGIRAVKLVFYQLIAPVAVICRIMPLPKAKAVFDNWLKKTISTFLEVFIRIAVMYLGIYLINVVVRSLNSMVELSQQTGVKLTFIQGTLATAFVLMGIVAFIRQAPKLIQDVFGIDAGGLGIGLKGLTSRLEQGGGLAAASAVGGGVTSAARRLTTGIKAGNKGWKNALSATSGLFGGTARGLYLGSKAKSFADVSKSAGTAAADHMEKYRKKEAYKAAHKDEVFASRIADMGVAIGEWATGGVEQYQADINIAKDMVSRRDSIFKKAESVVDKNENNEYIIPDNIEFKAQNKEEEKELNKLYEKFYKGKSLAVMKGDIEARKNIDYSKIDHTLIQSMKDEMQQKYLDEMDSVMQSDRTAEEKDRLTSELLEQMADITDEDALSNIRMRDAQEVARLENIVNQVNKATVKYVVNVAANDNDAEIERLGLKKDKLYGIKNDIEAYNEQFKSLGGKVTNEVTKDEVSIEQISSMGVAKLIDESANAYDSRGAKATANAEKVERNKKNRQDSK